MKSKLLFILFFFTVLTKVQSQQASMVKDICTGATASNPSSLINVNGTLYFIASCNYYPELWKSDGTDAGTVKVKSFDTPGGLSRLWNMAGVVYFAAETAANGIELWKSDGTDAGTQLVKDINPGKGSALTQASFLPAELNGKIYFCATGKGGYETEPWVSDGTAAGTKRLKDINSTFNLDGGSFPTRFTKVNDAVYFVATDGVNGYELWKTYGADSAVMVKNINPSADAFNTSNAGDRWLPFVNSKGILYFSASEDNLSNNYGLWKSDGTDAGTVKIASTGNIVVGLTLVGNEFLFFVSEGGPYGLWKSDGSTNTSKVKGNLSLGSLVGASNLIYFTAKDESASINYGMELWKSDGTLVGTTMVKDIVPGSNAPLIRDLYAVDNSIYFAATTTASGEELWKSDGTDAGTSIAAEIAPGNQSSQPQYYTSFNGALYLGASDVSHGRELWKLGITTGVSEKELSDIEIYPNPTTKNLFISSTVPLEGSTLSVLNLLGEIVFTKSLTDPAEELDLTKLENGLYALRLSSGKISVVKKIMVNK